MKKSYDEIYSSRVFGLRHPGDMLKDEIILKMIENADFNNKRFLDVGCGMGHTELCLSNSLNSLELTGADTSKEGIKVAAKVVDGNFVLANGCYLLFLDASFDYVLLKDALEHVADDQAVMKECFRALKQGGKAIIYVPHSLDGFSLSIESIVKKLTGFSIDPAVGHVRRYTKGGIMKTLKEVGFEIEQAFYFAHFLFGAISLIGILLQRDEQRAALNNKEGPLLALARLILTALKQLGKAELRLFHRCKGAGLFLVATKVTGGVINRE